MPEGQMFGYILKNSQENPYVKPFHTNPTATEMLEGQTFGYITRNRNKTLNMYNPTTQTPDLHANRT
jgi:hypothetical protein